MKFLSQINVNTEYTLPIVDGTNGQVLATDGNGNAYWGSISAGSTNLDALTDVILTSPTSGQLLRYGIPPGSGEAQPVWYNFTPNYLTPSSSIDNLGDVTITSATSGQVLQWNGSAWVNATLSTVEYVSKVQHLVKAGVAITKGQAVYVTSADGTNMIVGLASNASEATSSKTMGLAASSAAINGQIFVVAEGLLAGLDTSTANAGDPVWLGTNGNLIFGLLNKPVAPAHLVFIGIVTRVQQNNGEIFVKVQNGFELNEIHDALITSPTAGQLLRRDSDNLWKNWTPNYLTAHPTIANGGSVNNSNGTVIQDITLETNGHVTAITSVDLDTRYYTQNDISGIFGGEIPMAGYSPTNWDTAYNNTVTGISFSTSTGVLTLTQQDTGTITVDLDGRYLESLPSHTHAASDITSGTLSTDRLPKQELGISIVGNFGQWQLHSAYTNFNTPVNYWGWNYVQGNTNAPHQTSSQWYRGRFSLGNEYGFGNDPGDYWMEIAIPRYNLGDNAGNLFVRTAENGTIGGWQGVRAAYATNANYATSAGDSTNLGGLSSARYVKQDYYNEGYNWNTIGAANTDSAIVLRVESSASNPPAGDVYNWSLWQQGTKLRGSQIAVSAYGEPRMFFRGADGDNNVYAAWNEIIHSGNIASQTIGYASQALQVIGQSGQNYSSDNRTISPSEISPGYLQFGFTSWTNNNGAPYADYLHMRSYTDSSGGSDNLVMFKKSGIGMRIWQQSFGSSTAYSSYADVWTTENFSSTNVTNWNTAYGWGNHASAGYLTTEADTLATVTSRGNSTINSISVGSLSVPSFIYLTNAGTGNAFISESWGINLNGVSTHPVQVRGASFSVGYSLGAGTNYGTSNLYVAGNFGLGTTSPSYKLHVAGNAYINETLYVNQQTTVEDNLFVTDGINQNNIVGRPYAAWGASGTTTGAVVIKFPGDTNNYGMVHAVVDIYEYSSNTVCTVIIGGHNWYGAWYNYGANVIGQTDKQVRLGVVDGKFAIIIGDDSSSWSYGQVVLRKIQNGTYYQNSMRVYNDYVISQQSVNSSWISGDLRGLIVPGNLTVNGAITENSSIRYKENVKSIPSVSQKVEQLDAVSYNKIGSNQEEIGLIAEDVAELFPEVVKYDNEGRPDGVNYSRLSVILLKAVQELSQEVNELKKKLN